RGAPGAPNFRCLDDGDVIARYEKNGSVHVERLRAGAFETGFSRPACPVPFGGGWALLGADADRPARLDLQHEDGRRETLARSAPEDPDPAFVSRGEAISFPTSGGREAHAWFYPPRNPDFTAPEGERPPLVVRSHGGPTGASDNAYSSAIQYWTTRGFAVVDVNYGGSTGYGRAFRRQLEGQWGIVDVDDCCAAATWLAETGQVDADRLVVRGGSAGGYTTLAALAFRNVFRAGASLYGIGDLKALARDTHKFESRYLDRLIGPLPEAEAIYDERSPLLHADGISCPVIFLQGTEDKVVPPDQTEAMAAALRARGTPVALLLFEGEGHGFRRAENIVAALEAELSFFARIFGFEAPGVPEVGIPGAKQDSRDT
ncbi:MAG: S9 family peptidase, partial [Alphaproteobacteria bacterium]|nr:S9 family peptidase [Alphaproteobacteria bacterium]